MKQYFIFCLSILPITISCAQKEYVLDDEMIYHISVDSISKTLNFDEIVEDYIYIPLKKNPDYTIGKITQLLATEDRLFVVSDGIFCFDFEGNPIYSIINKGHARNEYVQCESVSISDDLLYMYDRGKLQTHVYEASSGKFLYNIPSPAVNDIYRIGNAFVIEDLFHLYTKTPLSDKKNRFFVYNEDFGTLKYRAFGEEQHLHHIGEPTTLGNDCVLFSDLYACKLYKILPDKIVSYLQIDCAPKYRNTTQQILQDINGADIKNDNLTWLQHVCETEFHIYGHFIFKKESYQFIFDKMSKHCKFVCPFFDVETPRIWSASLTDRHFSNDNYMIMSFTPDRLTVWQRRAKMNQLPPTHPDYKKQQIILDCKQEDNPIVVMYKFKRF